MGQNRRRRSEPQRPSVSKAHSSPGSGSPQDGERILLDEGFQQILPVCLPPRRAAWRLYTAWVEGALAVWRDGKLADPDEYSFGVRPDADGRERLKIRKGTDAVTTSGDRLLGIDQSNHKWEISAAGIAALRERLIKEQLPAVPVRVELVGTSKVQLVVEKPKSRTKAQSPSQPVASEPEPQPSTPQLTDAQIEEWVNDASVPRAWREIRRFAVKEFGDWKSVSTTAIIKAARDSAEFKKRVRPFPSENTFNRALGRKKS